MLRSPAFDGACVGEPVGGAGVMRRRHFRQRHVYMLPLPQAIAGIQRRRGGVGRRDPADVIAWRVAVGQGLSVVGPTGVHEVLDRLMGRAVLAQADGIEVTRREGLDQSVGSFDQLQQQLATRRCFYV